MVRPTASPPKPAEPPSTAEEVSALLDDYELIGVGGPNAAHSAAELSAANDRGRLRGIVAAHGEFEHGVTEYAVPVRDAGGHIRAAVSVVGRQQDLLSVSGRCARPSPWLPPHWPRPSRTTPRTGRARRTLSLAVRAIASE
ncbi:hypothetical protein [Streptomyces bottropensis]|uniref:hypothetical protein n=1 Tax=Streptomyces bottropensis TaxID=42235 RepID=UPI003691DD5B